MMHVFLSFFCLLYYISTATVLSVQSHHFLLFTTHFITYKTVSDLLLAKKSGQSAYTELDGRAAAGELAVHALIWEYQSVYKQLPVQ